MLHKFILLLAIFSLSVKTVCSQSLDEQIKSSYALLQAYTPTGVLLDRSPLNYLMTDSLSPDLYYPGSGITCTQFRFESLYNLFYHASFTGAPFLYHPNDLPRLIDSLHVGFDESNATWSQIESDSNYCDVVIGSLLLKYNKVKLDAFRDGWLRYNPTDSKFFLQLTPFQITDTIWPSGQFGVGNFIIHTETIYPDSVDIIENWKTTDDLFSFAALTSQTIVDINSPVKFYFPEKLNLTNWGNFQMEIDFDDGNGYIYVEAGDLKSIFYSESGIKQIRARVKNALGQIVGDLPMTSLVSVIKADIKADEIFSSRSPLSCNVDTSEGVGVARLTIKYAPSSNGKLMNPFILVEGFESSDYSKIDPELDVKRPTGYGGITWATIAAGINTDEYPQFALLPHVIDSLNQLGYDVGFVDFRTNRSKIEKNANALISILEQVQNKLLTNESEKGVQLMGASMGGLISRLAILKMERSECCHPVKVFYSFSTPHKGANIPISAQHLTHDIGNKFNFIGIFNRSNLAYTQVLNSPAARQLLFVHRETSARNDHLAFYNYMNQIGYPTSTKNIAITDGSLNGFLHRADNTNLNSPVLNELQNLFHFNLQIWAPTKLLTFFDIPPRKFILANASGISIEHSPTSTSNQPIYRHGRDIHSNLRDYRDQFLTWVGYATGLHLLNLFYEKATITFPQYSIAIQACRLISVGVYVGVADSRLNDGYQNNISANIFSNLEYLHHPAEGFDNAPADVGNIVESIVEPFNQIKTGFGFISYFPTSSFVPSVSALDDSRETRTNLIGLNQNVVSQKFDYIWAKNILGKNEYLNNPHVSISLDFTSWLMNSLIELDHPSKNLSAELNGINFNFGEPEIGLIYRTNYYFYYESFPSTIVRNNSELQFNRISPVGASNTHRVVLPKLNSNFEISTRNLNCTPVLVQNEGTIELGEPAASPFTNTAHVQFRPGSTLELFSNSTLNIHQGSRLTIDSGATLIIHPNANIYLEGTNSVLEIKGRVVFLPNAVMELTGAGYLLVNQDSNQVANIYDLWEAQGPATVKFHGQQSSQRLMELASVARMSTRLKFDFKSGNIYMHPGVMLDLNGDVELRNLQIQALGNLPHKGIYLHGQENVHLNHLTISGGEKAITSTMIQYRNPLVLNQCSLINNFNGVVTYGGQVNFTGSVFTGNTTAWMAYDMDGNSQLSDCQFLSNSTAIDIMGQHDANLNITQSIIEHNDWGIKSFGQLYCRMNCSSVSNNSTGIYAGNYQWLLGGRSRNKFQNNQLAIHLEEVDNLFIFEGENDFSGSQMYISGTFSGIAMNYLSLNPITNAYELNVKDNRLPVIAGNTRVYLRDWDSNPIYMQNHTPMPQYMQVCNSGQTVGFEDYVLQNWNSDIMVNLGPNQLTLNHAVEMARSLITTNELQNTKLDLDAVSLFDEIFAQVRTLNPEIETTSKDYVILEIALNKMMEAHNNAYRFNLIPRVRAVEELPKNIYLQAMLEEIDHRIGRESANPSDESLLYSLILTKAQLYRTAEHYDYALETLQELKLVNNQFWAATAEYWECICDLERKLIKELVKAEEFEAMRLECMLLGPQERRLQPVMEGDPLQHVKAAANYSLFPNPATNKLFVRSDKLLGSASLRIMDMTGKLVKSAQWNDRGDVFEMDVSSLKSGVYAITVVSDSQTEVLRFTKF